MIFHYLTSSAIAKKIYIKEFYNSKQKIQKKKSLKATRYIPLNLPAIFSIANAHSYYFPPVLILFEWWNKCRLLQKSSCI